MNAYFAEEQHFRQKWLWVIIAAVAMAQMIGAIVLSMPGVFPQRTPTPVFVPGLLLMFAFLIPWCLWKLRMETYVMPDGIVVRFFPFVTRMIRFDEIERIYVRQYKPIQEYGGWGIKGTTGNRVYNVSGNMGLQIELKKKGRKVMIGSQQAERLERTVLERMKTNSAALGRGR